MTFYRIRPCLVTATSTESLLAAFAEHGAHFAIRYEAAFPLSDRQRRKLPAALRACMSADPERALARLAKA